jgi:exopolyphosphatase / guanosine-5'-triphosphate,3'-diphosphate pyrophosphatase
MIGGHGSKNRAASPWLAAAPETADLAGMHKPSPPPRLPTFPLRVAAIDVGSNAMRLLAAEFTTPDAWFPLAEQRVAVRLGAGVFGAGGELREDTMQAGVAALAAFRQRLDELGVVIYRAAATSATREAANGADFIDRAWTEAGIRLETITGGEEARLVWLAASQRLPVHGRRWIFTDLGGGSVEIGQAQGDAVLWSESHAMGAVRLLNELGPAARSPRAFRRLAGEYIDTMVSHIAMTPGDVAGMIATGGNIEELARLADAPIDADGAARLALDALDRVIETLAVMTTRERIDELRLRPDRADVVLPAALVYERIARLARVESIIVPFVGLKDGLLIDTAHNALQHEARTDRQQRDLLTGAIALGRRYRFDEAHARQVARLAVSLFDQLHRRLELDEADRLILLAAALLHDIGQYISYRKHHKHSYYLISNASLPDLTPDDTLLVALVARYHRRAEPSPEHDGYAELSDETQQRVARLASLLRIADALDRQHRQHVREVRARLNGERLRLEIVARDDLILEEWALAKKAQLIGRLLDVRLDLAIRWDEATTT